MGIRHSLARAIMGKQFVHSAIISDFMSSFGWQPSANQEALVKKVNGWAYTCITKNATACAQVPLRLYSVRGASNTEKLKTERVSVEKRKFLQRKVAERVAGAYELEEVLEHPIIDLLRRVNPTQNAYDLKDSTFRYLETVATSYWYLERGLGNEVVNIWPLMSQKVKIIPDKTNGIKCFVYGSGSNKETYKPEDIVHFKYGSLTDPFIGDSPLKACEQAVDLHNDMNNYEIASFRNGGKPNTVMQVPADGFVSDADRKRIESDYKRKYGGVKNNGKFMVLSGGAELKEFGFSPKDMSFTKGRSVTLEEICGAFGVPISFVKIQDVSRANAWASLDIWAQYTINPKLTMVEQKLNEQFTRNWGEGLFLLFDDARPKDAEFKLKERESNINTKFSSINEERAKEGLGEVEWGDTPVMPVMPMMPTPPEPKPEPKPEDDKKDCPELIIKREGQSSAPQTPNISNTVFVTMLTIFFKRIEAEVVRGIEQEYTEKAQGKTSSPEDLLSTIFNKTKWEGELEATMMPFVKGVMTQSIIDALEKLDPSAVYNASSPEVITALERRKGEIKTIISTKEEMVRRQLKQGIGSGESRGQLIKRIRSHFDSRALADRVVRTESIWAHNEGTMQAWMQSGVVTGKKWDTVIDDRNCPFCEAMNGKVIELEGNYYQKGDSLEVGGQVMNFTYETVQHPPLHPQCRCQLIPIIVDED